jgi:hypothetical protein
MTARTNPVTPVDRVGTGVHHLVRDRLIDADRLPDALHRAAAPDPDRVFVHCGSASGPRSVSFGELEAASRPSRPGCWPAGCAGATG